MALISGGGGGGSIPSNVVLWRIRNDEDADVIFPASAESDDPASHSYGTTSFIDQLVAGDRFYMQGFGTPAQTVMGGGNGSIFWLVRLDSPAARAYVRLSANAAIGAGTSVPFNTVVFDPLSFFNAGLGGFVVPAGQDGLYLVGAALQSFNT